jgi:phosphotransferase system HPr (HPr) family protein
VSDVTLSIHNPSGLHARPAALFVKTAAAFTSDMTITNLSRDPGRTVNPKSLLALLTLGVSSGHEVRISADGEDAEAALAALEQLVADGLGE